MNCIESVVVAAIHDGVGRLCRRNFCKLLDGKECDAQISSKTLFQIICKVTALNQPRSRQLVLDVRVVDRSRDEAGDSKGGLHDDHGQQ
jgi:hypothetical protein